MRRRWGERLVEVEESEGERSGEDGEDASLGKGHGGDLGRVLYWRPG